MFGAVAFGIFVLFFIIILTVRNERALKWAVRTFLALVLGALALAGIGAIVTGILEAIGGSIDAWQLLIQLGAGLLLTAVGAVPLYIYFLAGPASARRLALRQARYPDQPWMWLARWTTGELGYSGGGTVLFMWFVLLVLTAGLGFASYANRVKIIARLSESPLEVIIFFAIFCGLLLLGFFAAVRLLRGYLKFGNSAFRLSGPCGIVGGDLAGTIYTRMKEIPESGFELELQCRRHDLTPRRSKYAATNREQVLWTRQKKLRQDEVTMGERGVEIPVNISIPPQARESNAWAPLERIQWTLSATASFGGRAYLSQFDVPVFLTSRLKSGGSQADGARTSVDGD